jgi:hypothetical protein
MVAEVASATFLGGTRPCGGSQNPEGSALQRARAEPLEKAASAASKCAERKGGGACAARVTSLADRVVKSRQPDSLTACAALESDMTHISGFERSQLLLLPEAVDDYVGPDNPVRFIDAFVDGLDLAAAGFKRVTPQVTGRPGYAPGDLLKLYIYGYLNRVRSSRRLEAHPLLDAAEGMLDDLAAAVENVGPRRQALRHAIERVLVFDAGDRADAVRASVKGNSWKAGQSF